MWLGKLTTLNMPHWVDWDVKPQHKQTIKCLLFQIRVLAEDGGTPRLSSTATVYVGVERNQNAPFYGQQNYTVTVNEIQDLGIPILTLNAVDQDIQVNTFSSIHATT